jgi:hypothetical protein
MSDACEVIASPAGRTRLPMPQDWRNPVVWAVSHECFPHNDVVSLGGLRRRYWLCAEMGEKRVQGTQAQSPSRSACGAS